MDICWREREQLTWMRGRIWCDVVVRYQGLYLRYMMHWCWFVSGRKTTQSYVMVRIFIKSLECRATIEVFIRAFWNRHPFQINQNPKGWLHFTYSQMICVQWFEENKKNACVAKSLLKEKQVSFGLEIPPGSFQAYQTPNIALKSLKSEIYKQKNLKRDFKSLKNSLQ